MIVYLTSLIIAEIAASSAVIFIKLSKSNPFILATYRLLFAALILTPVYLYEYKKHKRYYSLKYIKYSLVPGIFLSFHFITWIAGAKLTDASNATVIVNMVPAIMPLVSIVVLKEKLNMREIIGTSIALIGIIYLGLSDFRLSTTTFKGDILCFISMILFAFYLALGRKNREIPSVWLYVVPLYYLAGIITFSISSVFAYPVKIPSGGEIFYILSLAIIPTIIGHSLINFSVRYFKSQTVSIINQIQLIFAGIMAYIFLKETPAGHLYVAALPIIGGSVIAITEYKSNRKPVKKS